LSRSLHRRNLRLTHQRLESLGYHPGTLILLHRTLPRIATVGTFTWLSNVRGGLLGSSGIKLVVRGLPG